MVSSQMMSFLLSLPDYAFSMAGDVGTEDRLLYTAAPAGTPASMMSRYTRVVYRFGWRGQGTHITVLFVMGAEVLAIAVQASAWGTMAASTWKQMILRHAPLGIVEFPVLEY